MRSQSRQSVCVRSGQAGFTLVELLVVIGIIAVLISILLPSLAKARGAALKVACSANMRSVGQMFQMYVSENRGRLPLSKNASWGSYPCAAIWPMAISPKDPPAGDAMGWSFDDFDKHTANAAVFRCPAQAADPDVQRTYVLSGRANWWIFSTDTQNMMWGRSIAFWECSGGKMINLPARELGRTRSAETIMMVEMLAMGPESSDNNDAPGGRRYHMGGEFAQIDFGQMIGRKSFWAHEMDGANYLFCDGHVEYLKSPIRYHDGIWSGEFDNRWCGATDGSFAFAKLFSADKTAGNDMEAGWWWMIPNP